MFRRSGVCQRSAGVYRSINYGDSLAINPVGTLFAETAGFGKGEHPYTDNDDSWRLAKTGLTSTTVAPLALMAAAITSSPEHVHHRKR
jgi:hypothetical protein